MIWTSWSTENKLTKAFKKSVRRQAMKLGNKNERITLSKMKITGKLPGSCRAIQNTLNNVTLNNVKIVIYQFKTKDYFSKKKWNISEEHIKN